jgi:hypothetical protein
MMSYTIRKSVFTTGFALALYYFLMEFYYQYFIVPDYARFGFNLNLNFEKYIETKFLFIIILGILVYVSRVSEFIYSIIIFLIIFFLVPSLITYSFSDQLADPLYSIIIMVVSLSVISTHRLKIPYLKSSKLSFGIVMLAMIILLIPILLKFGVYLNVSNLLLKDVYNTRDLFDENASTLMNYLFNWLIKAVVPVAMIYFLINKHYRYAGLSFIIMLYLYSISGNKLVYITSFVMLFFFISGKDYIDKCKIISVMLIVGLLTILVVDYSFNSELKGIFVMRMLFLPSYLNYYYFDFFNGTPLYFAESHFFNLFSTYPYDKPIGYIIAQNYIHVNDMNANNGLIGDGFMNLGYAGVGLSIFVVTLIFQFFNSIQPDARYLGIFFVMIFLFLSVPLLSMFITGGLWILFLMGITIMRKTGSSSAIE